jgi:chemotaxis protein MotB
MNCMARRDDIADETEINGVPAWMRNAGTVAPPADDDQEIWLLSYSDMVTLLFSVFVMLTAITSVKDQLPRDPPPEPAAVSTPAPDLASDVAEVNSPPSVPVIAETPSPPPDDAERLKPDEIAVEAPEPLSARWLRRLAESGAPPGVTVQVSDRRIGIDIGAAVLFSAGQAELSAEGKRVLARLVPALAAIPGEIMVEGHTDATPLSGGGRFPSNWELSAARAATVARTLIADGLPSHRFAAVGYADTRPLTVKTDAESLARNRRVTLSLRPPAESLRPPAESSPPAAVTPTYTGPP